MIRQWVYTRMMIKKIRKKLQNWCFFKKRFRITLLWVGVQSANAKKKKNSFPCIFLIFIENNIREKRILKGLVKLIEWVTQECCKKSILQKKKVHGKAFSCKSFLNDSVISGGTEERRRKTKIMFRTSFRFFTENHCQNDQIFWKVW